MVTVNALSLPKPFLDTPLLFLLFFPCSCASCNSPASSSGTSVILPVSLSSSDNLKSKTALGLNHVFALRIIAFLIGISAGRSVCL